MLFYEVLIRYVKEAEAASASFIFCKKGQNVSKTL